MKKILLTFVLSFISCLALPVMAQKIILDEVDSKLNMRTTLTDAIICRSFTDRLVLRVSLESIIEEGDTTLLLGMSINGGNPMRVEKGGRLLIRLGDDSVLELEASSEEKDNIGQVSTSGGTIIKQYYVHPSYPIEKEQLFDMMNYGVKKVRLEMTPDYYDKEFPKDKIGAAVTKLYSVLWGAISVPKSFDADF
ncbi:MAG: hypothetical protein LUC49_02365 [Prevotella sp.]|nr:hypothetical protein [Prevotella sp.]